MNLKIFLSICFAVVCASQLKADSLDSDVATLIESSCIGCHDAGTETGLNLESLSHDLSDADAQRKWVQVFDRVAAGEMPPKSEERPNSSELEAALTSLKRDLTAVSLAKQELGRVPARRLTKLELGYTLQDLLKISNDVTSSIPDEVESGRFDSIGAHQRVSAGHLESYLKAADEALGHAVRSGANPFRDYGDMADNNFAHLESWHEKPLTLGGSITRKLNFSNGIVLFHDVDYLTHFTYGIQQPGIHRLIAKVAAYQSDQPITAKIIVKDQTGGARLAKTIDLMPGEPRTMVVETFLKPGDTPYLTFQNVLPDGQDVFTAGGAKNYKGPGMAIRSQRVEGPLFETWPPPSTTALLEGIDSDESDLDNIRLVARRFALRAFRHSVSDAEVEDFVKLAKPAIADGRNVRESLNVTLRSMLSSPQFLMFSGKPGKLDDYALASRLSYFLWKSMPDDELLQLAREGRLSDEKTLSAQIERILDDPKSNRFVKDFVGQWLWLNRLNATSPDDGLYPEFDELLGTAIPQETELFFASLIEDNLAASNLIDSDFTFVNRRLAEHYGMKGVDGQDFRRVDLPDDSLRGGVLTQAALLKTTANGTTTSPVTRGNFVLTNFLGTPPSPPPPSVGSIEPDTRGQTTIREILAAHRNTDTCNQCHREIDPPGFALESFDPIGGFRTNYRSTGGEQTFGDFTVKMPPKQGPPVDSSGVTADGKSFTGIGQFKQLLMANEELVVRNFVSQLLVYSTGGEIKFADRECVESILNETREEKFPVRDIIHAVVQSRLFQEK